MWRKLFKCHTPLGLKAVLAAEPASFFLSNMALLSTTDHQIRGFAALLGYPISMFRDLDTLAIMFDPPLSLLCLLRLSVDLRV